MEISKAIRFVGVNDHQVDLFEGQYPVPNGVSYNSYVILDTTVAVMDTVDANFVEEWLDNVAKVTDEPKYLVIQHMEPDHSAGIIAFAKRYPESVLVSNAMAFQMMEQYFGPEFESLENHRLIVNEGDVLALGEHELHFVAAPMVHWPEVMVTYESKEKTLFSADGFGRFGALDVEEDWDAEARRYFIGIVGKYGEQTQALLQKAAGLEIARICPLHGPVLTENLGHYLNLYDTWSSYRPEEEGVAVFYTSVYGHTKAAAELVAESIRAKGAPAVVLHDLAREDMSVCVADAFRYSRLVLASTTYNGSVFPFMHTFLNDLSEHNFQNRTIAVVENGTWAPQAANVMKGLLAGCRNLNWIRPTVTIRSALNEESKAQIEAMTTALCKDYLACSDTLANKADMTAMFRIGYGLYVVTCRDGEKDNGLIVNTVCQVSDSPSIRRVAVNINKANYSHDLIQKTGKLNVNCLSVAAPFRVFQRFGFQSGRNADKFEGLDFHRADNGIAFLPQYSNAMLSLTVEKYVDMESHGMFICTVDEARVISDLDTMTYTYYQNNVKPKPPTEKKNGFVCKVCGYIYEGDTLPDGYICPLCKHGVDEFERL